MMFSLSRTVLLCAIGLLIASRIQAEVENSAPTNLPATPAAGMGTTVHPVDSNQVLERTSFQTGKPWSENGNLRSDVAIVYGIDAGLPQRIGTWRDHGYRIHV
ncbi:MAG TPA: hypothetical protein VMJ12_04885, partial [Candidatus Acidoferrales bacterium]|nr:hypothetical protein [Candidatus Acidoferrales bacterium]